VRNHSHDEDDGGCDAQAARRDVQVLGRLPVAAGSCRVLGDFPVSGLRTGRGGRVGTGHELVAAVGRGDIPLSLAAEQPASPNPGTAIHRALPHPHETHPDAAAPELAAARARFLNGFLKAIPAGNALPSPPGAGAGRRSRAEEPAEPAAAVPADAGDRGTR